MSTTNGASLDWERVKRGRPCPVCEREDGLCSISEGGEYAACYRLGGPGAKQKTNSAGLPYHVHRLNGPADDNGHAAKPARKPTPARAHPDDLNDIYSALLSNPRLALTEANLDDLARRGFPAREARHRLYASMPARGRGEIAADLAGRFGKETLLGVPGFFVNDRGELGVASFPGLAIPSRDHIGRIAALIVRPDKLLDPKQKYFYLSSAKRGGAGSGAPAHVPLGVVGPVARVRLTEGPLKADLATILSGTPTIAAAGVNNWRPCLKALKSLKVEVVCLAFDADWRTNDRVAQATVACVEGLKAAGFRVEFETWDASDGKGIDDVLVSGGAPMVLTGCAAEALLHEVEQVAYPNGRSTAARPSANDNGDGTVRLTAEAGDDEPKVSESPDDPHRLSRIFLDERYRGPDGLELRYYQGEYQCWNGAYHPTPEKDVRAQLTASIKVEFNRLNVEEIATWEERGKVDARGKECAKPTVRKVTSGLANNAAGALAGYTLLHHLTGQPAWLGDDPPFPADEVLPTRNALVHLPGLVAGEPRVIIPPTPRFFGGYCLDYDFALDAPEPANWLTFLGAKPVTETSKVRLQLWADDPQCIEALQEWFGYHLLPDTSQQKIGMVIGPRRSGKGTIGRILRRMIGPENVANPTLSGLSSHFGLNPLINKPCAIISDARLSGKTDVAAVVERLLSISGEDAQTIDRKHLAAWNGLLPTRFTFISNELPRLSDTSGALAGRMIIFPLTKSFYGQEDSKLTNLLMQEMPGILLWAIEGWRRLRERGHFVQPDSGREMVEDLEELSSPVGSFLKERCIVEPGREIMAKKLYNAWREWCVDKGRDHPGDEQVFGRNMHTVFPGLKTPSRRLPDGSRKRFYEGIDLQFVPEDESSNPY